MAEVKIVIEGEIGKVSGEGSRAINRTLKELLPIVTAFIAEDIKTKAREYASGIGMPANKLPEQANHPMGQSDSGNVLTNFLEKSIEVRKRASPDYEVIATTTYASMVEFGTGLYGPNESRIVPTSKEALKFDTPAFGTIVAASIKGQRPNPFMRGAIWYVQDNLDETVKKINEAIK